jgi:hypothetical protein
MTVSLKITHLLIRLCPQILPALKLDNPLILKKGESMMTTQKLKALVNTVIKQSTLDSSQITDLTQKFSLTAGDELEIND